LGVRGAEVAGAALAVGDPPDAHVPEDRGQRAHLTADRTAAPHTLGVHDALQFLLAPGLEIQTILKE